MEVSSTAPKQGRIVPSRSLHATASSTSATGVLSGRKPTATGQDKPSKPSASSAVRRTMVSNTIRPMRLNRMHAPPEDFTATYPIANSGSSRGLGASHRPSLKTSLGVKATTAFELEIASQLYPWIFMRHTLTASSNIAAAEFQANFAARVEEVTAEEQVLADNRRRYQVERETELLNDLSSQHLNRVVLSMVKTFVRSQGMYQEAMINSTRLPGTDWKTLCSVRSSIRELDRLTEESNKLWESVRALLCVLPPRSLLASVLVGLRPVLDMRLENLALSRKLMVTICDNVSNLQHLESLKVCG